jgi:hypothetical protein
MRRVRLAQEADKKTRLRQRVTLRTGVKLTRAQRRELRVLQSVHLAGGYLGFEAVVGDYGKQPCWLRINPKNPNALNVYWGPPRVGTFPEGDIRLRSQILEAAHRLLFSSTSVKGS